MQGKYQLSGTCTQYAFYIWIEAKQKGPYVRNTKIELCIACSRGHSTGHFNAKIRCLAQFLTDFSRICMVSSNNKAQGQSQGHVTSTIMWYFLGKKHNKKITWQHKVCLIFNITVYITIYVSQCILGKLYL